MCERARKKELQKDEATNSRLKVVYIKVDAPINTTMEGVDSKDQRSDNYSDVLKTSYSDAFAFTDQERMALDLYDQLREQELQHSLLLVQADDGKWNCAHENFHLTLTCASDNDVLILSDDEVQEQLIKAERELLDARAEYELRNKLVDNTLIMDPILKAIHGGEHTDYAEK